MSSRGEGPVYDTGTDAAKIHPTIKRKGIPENEANVNDFLVIEENESDRQQPLQAMSKTSVRGYLWTLHHWVAESWANYRWILDGILHTTNPSNRPLLLSEYDLYVVCFNGLPVCVMTVGFRERRFHVGTLTLLVISDHKELLRIILDNLKRHARQLGMLELSIFSDPQVEHQWWEANAFSLKPHTPRGIYQEALRLYVANITDLSEYDIPPNPVVAPERPKAPADKKRPRKEEGFINPKPWDFSTRVKK